MSKRLATHILLICVALFIIIAPRLSEKPEVGKAEEAATATMAFLKLVDSEQYDSSWNAAAKLLKEKVTQEEWAAQLSKVRAVSGPMVERQQKDISYATVAKDSPEGEYIVMTFDSHFQLKESATETVTLMLEEDNNWRVAGYFIQ